MKKLLILLLSFILIYSFAIPVSAYILSPEEIKSKSADNPKAIEIVEEDIDADVVYTDENNKTKQFRRKT